jgi:hypothetical protein
VVKVERKRRLRHAAAVAAAAASPSYGGSQDEADLSEYAKPPPPYEPPPTYEESVEIAKEAAQTLEQLEEQEGARPKTSNHARRLLDLGEEVAVNGLQEFRNAVRKAGFYSPRTTLRRINLRDLRNGVGGSITGLDRRRSVQEQVILENGELEDEEEEEQELEMAERQRLQATATAAEVTVGPRKLKFMTVEDAVAGNHKEVDDGNGEVGGLLGTSDKVLVIQERSPTPRPKMKSVSETDLRKKRDSREEKAKEAGENNSVAVQVMVHREV